MKDTIITVKTKKRELWYLLAAFILAFFLNILSIIIYHTAWKELYTQFGYVLVLTVVLYVVILIIRLVIRGVAKIFGKKLCI
ncbi:MAG TPA: hypothetical protein ENK25_09005 [Bacteroidetes bacterium]|nr:hypothetical protein [Bacteroidota bacterium]